MSTMKSLFESMWMSAAHLRKKAYMAGLVVLSGAAVVAFVFIGVNGFAGSTANPAHLAAYLVEEDESNEDAETELMTEEASAEESLPHLTARAMADYGYSQTVETEVSETLAKEPETEKTLKTATDNTAAEKLSVEDYTALVRIVEAEATDEDLKGKILIANVVLNRVATSRFPDTIYDVVHQKLNGRAQFSPIDDGRYYTVPITSSTEEAVMAALNGTDYSQGALFFVAKSLASESAGSWFDRNLNFIMKHGVHSFYKY